MNEKVYVAPEAVVVKFEEKDLLSLSHGAEGGLGEFDFNGNVTKNW